MFSAKQELVLEFPYGDYDGLICDGAVRSGKTSAMSLSFILWAMGNFNNMNFALCGKTIQSAERNIIRELEKIVYLQQNFKMRYSSTNKLLTMARGNKVNYFYVFGGKDESSYSLIQGLTLAGVFLDEVALMPRSFVEQAIARCSVDGSKYFFNCNPESPDHWFLTEWIDKSNEKNCLHLHFLMDDNPSLSEKVKERYMKAYSGVFFQRYILGKWVRAEGLIYPDFANNTENYIIDEVDRSKLSFVNVGVDFGGNKSKHTFVAVGFTRGMKEVIVLEDELVETDVTPTELDSRYVDFVKMCYNNYSKATQTYADSAEQTLIKGFKVASAKNGLANVVNNARKGEIKDRIMLVLKLMAQGRFKVMRNCKNVIDALKNAVWDDKKVDVRLDDGTTNIDTIDGLEYAIEPMADNLLKGELINGN